MASIALDEIKTEKSRKFLTSSIVLCSIVLAVFFYMPLMHAYNTVNIKNAAEYTNTLDAEKIEVYVTFPKEYYFNLNKLLIPLFDLYSNKEVITPGYDAARQHELAAPSRSLFGTWTREYPLPPYYSLESTHRNAIVLIGVAIAQELPERLEKRLEDYRLARIYSEGYLGPISQYIVRVYVPRPELVLTFPKGGESLNGTQIITWLSSIPAQGQRFKIEVCRNSILACQEIGIAYSRWFYIWDIDYNEFPSGDDYKIRISLLDDYGEILAHNESGYFSITGHTP